MAFHYFSPPLALIQKVRRERDGVRRRNSDMGATKMVEIKQGGGVKIFFKKRSFLMIA
jgi:hypothetical protein